MRGYIQVGGSREIETGPGVQWRSCGCGGRLVSHLLTSGSVPVGLALWKLRQGSPLGPHSSTF